MVDTNLYFLGSLSPNILRQIPEIQDFGVNYINASFKLGMELPVLAKSNRHFTGSFLTEIGYDYLGGNEGNLGSNRHQGTLDIGWKQNLSKYLFVAGKVGLGFGKNHLNFGKGFSPDDENVFTGNYQAMGGLQYCTDLETCLMVFGGFFDEYSIAGASDVYRNYGPLVGLGISFPVTSTIKTDADCLQQLLDVQDEYKKCHHKLQTQRHEVRELKSQLDTLIDEHDELAKNLNQQNTIIREKCGLNLKDVSKIEPHLWKIPDLSADQPPQECSTRLDYFENKLNICTTGDSNSQTYQYDILKKELTENIAQVKKLNALLRSMGGDQIKGALDCGSYLGRDLNVINLPKIIFFPNDNPDIDLRPQWFNKVTGEYEYECLSNPLLDQYIHMLIDIDKKIHKDAVLNKSDLKIKVRIQGYANETGDKAHNLKLAKGRARSVAAYLLAPDTPFPSELQDTARSSKEIDKRLQDSLSQGLDMNKWFASRRCGARDQNGKRLGLLSSPELKRDIEVINETENMTLRDFLSQIQRDFGSQVNAKDPRFRMVKIELDFILNGKVLRGQELENIVRRIQVGGSL